MQIFRAGANTVALIVMAAIAVVPVLAIGGAYAIMTSPYVTEQNLTDIVLKRWQDIPDPRLREVMQSLIKHLHGFVREIEPTGAEWFKAIDWITRTLFSLMTPSVSSRSLRATTVGT